MKYVGKICDSIKSSAMIAFGSRLLNPCGNNGEEPNQMSTEVRHSHTDHRSVHTLLGKSDTNAHNEVWAR